MVEGTWKAIWTILVPNFHQIKVNDPYTFSILFSLDYPNACYISIISLHPQCGKPTKMSLPALFVAGLWLNFFLHFHAVDQERFERRRPSSLHGQWRPLWQIFLFGKGSAKVWGFVGWFCWMVLKRKKVANHRFGGIDWNEKSRWTSDGISTNIERVDEFLDTRWFFVTFLGWLSLLSNPFKGKWWPPTGIWKGHIESPGISLLFFFAMGTNVDRCMS